jgi:hypothetical protein
VREGIFRSALSSSSPFSDWSLIADYLSEETPERPGDKLMLDEKAKTYIETGDGT